MTDNHAGTIYNPWPIGAVPVDLRRTEPELIKDMGYAWNDPRDIVGLLERKVAAFAGSRYAVAVDCCTHALELSLRYLMYTYKLPHGYMVTIPKNTYISVPIMLKQLGFDVRYNDFVWTGCYSLLNTHVIDAAVRWRKGMYVPDTLWCISFQIKKRIPIGRGGMILTDSEQAYNWLKLASYDGRDLNTPYDKPGHLKMHGFHYYMTPEDAARGIMLMDATPEICEDTGNNNTYPDIEKMMML